MLPTDITEKIIGDLKRFLATEPKLSLQERQFLQYIIDGMTSINANAEVSKLLDPLNQLNNAIQDIIPTLVLAREKASYIPNKKAIQSLLTTLYETELNIQTLSNGAVLLIKKTHQEGLQHGTR